MLNTAFPHLVPKTCLRKTVTPLAIQPQLSPVRSLQFSLEMELLELLELLKCGTNRAAASRETLSGSATQTKSLFPRKSDIWNLGFVGT